MAKGGRYLSPEKMLEIAKLISAGKSEDALSMVTSGSSRGSWKVIEEKPEEFLNAESNGTIRVVILGPKGKVCLERPAEDYAKMQRKYIYHDLEKVL